MLCVNSEHKLDVIQCVSSQQFGGKGFKSTLDISYMRCSLELPNDNVFLIGTEDSLVYLVDLSTMEILDRI